MFGLFSGWEIHRVPGVMRISDKSGYHREISFTIQTRKRKLRKAPLVNMIAMHCQDIARHFGGDVLEIRLRWGGLMDGYSRITIQSMKPIRCVIHDVPSTGTYFKDIAIMGSDKLVWKI